MKKVIIILSLLLIAIFLGGYSSLFSSKIECDFYYWRSVYDERGNQEPKYIKVLDIAYRKKFSFQKTLFSATPKRVIVPVIYMDNSVWSKMRASTMVDKVLNVLEAMPIKYNEIQVDCDWTQKSRDVYFEFLKHLKLKSSKKLSATIRLHQVKYYQKTGVPPIDYGVLMYYNMSDFKEINTKNYILDLDVAKKYHHNFDSYPLALNLALPLYSQITIIRFSTVVGLIDGIRERDLDGNFIKIKEHLYRVKKNHYFKGRLFYEGDTIRVDEVSIEMLQQTIRLLEDILPKPKEIIFYRWENREEYGIEKLKETVKSWS